MGWRNDRRTVDAVVRAGCAKEAETPSADACMIARRAADRLLPCCAIMADARCWLAHDHRWFRPLMRHWLAHHSAIVPRLSRPSARPCAARNMVAAATAVRPPSGDDLRQIVATAECYF
ncbi:hypothetical protein F511_45456 [Dorcoceras hygrometricum]|uniref:Uncharacterized protein n=1 Tax=Dorcoceras hygrometricum TaxID=472368 RepID=A0A2Z7A3P0_9LAMI|nr:hypothetical protein F511_45456 [Dorcoceras hygrometricum]